MGGSFTVEKGSDALDGSPPKKTARSGENRRQVGQGVVFNKNWESEKGR